MTLHTTRWRPDTCTCIIEYSWEDTAPEEQRTHSVHRVTNKCEAHKNLNDKEIYAAVTEENPRKNLALSKLMDRFPHLIEEITDESGNKYKRFKERHKPTFKFDSDRHLVIDIPNLSSRDKYLAKAEINKHFKNAVDLA